MRMPWQMLREIIRSMLALHPTQREFFDRLKHTTGNITHRSSCTGASIQEKDMGSFDLPTFPARNHPHPSNNNPYPYQNSQYNAGYNQQNTEDLREIETPTPLPSDAPNGDMSETKVEAVNTSPGPMSCKVLPFAAMDGRLRINGLKVPLAMMPASVTGNLIVSGTAKDLSHVSVSDVTVEVDVQDAMRLFHTLFTLAILDQLSDKK